MDNSQTKTAPVFVEEVPTYRNLFGSIDRTVDRRGRLVTNFTQIKAGSLLRANGGYLVFNIEDALTEPFVYKSLKRTLKSGCMQIESFNPWIPFSIGELRPEPIPINTKVVVVGNPMLYYMLRFYDEEFRSRVQDQGRLRHRDAPGREGADAVRPLRRRDRAGRAPARPSRGKPSGRSSASAPRAVGDKTKLLTHFSQTADLIREADYFARNQNSELVDACTSSRPWRIASTGPTASPRRFAS